MLGSWCNFALYLLCCDYVRAKFQRERKVLIWNNNNNRKWGPEQAGWVMDWCSLSDFSWSHKGKGAFCCPEQPTYIQALTPLALCAPGSRYTFFKRKEESLLSFYFLLCREVFHCFGLTVLLTNFHSAVKKRKKKNLSKCWYHFQTVLSASQLTGNSWCSQTSPLFTHRPGALKKAPHPVRLSLNVTGGIRAAGPTREPRRSPELCAFHSHFGHVRTWLCPPLSSAAPRHVSLWQPLLRAQLFLKPTGK